MLPQSDTSAAGLLIGHTNHTGCCKATLQLTKGVRRAYRSEANLISVYRSFDVYFKYVTFSVLKFCPNMQLSLNYLKEKLPPPKLSILNLLNSFLKSWRCWFLSC